MRRYGLLGLVLIVGVQLAGCLTIRTTVRVGAQSQPGVEQCLEKGGGEGGPGPGDPPCSEADHQAGNC